MHARSLPTQILHAAPSRFRALGATLQWKIFQGLLYLWPAACVARQYHLAPDTDVKHMHGERTGEMDVSSTPGLPDEALLHVAAGRLQGPVQRSVQLHQGGSGSLRHLWSASIKGYCPQVVQPCQPRLPFSCCSLLAPAHCRRRGCELVMFPELPSRLQTALYSKGKPECCAAHTHRAEPDRQWPGWVPGRAGRPWGCQGQSPV